MKKLFIIFASFISLAFLFTAVSFASTKSIKDGVNQAGGCKTKSLNYHYTLLDSGKVVYGKLTVGVCANEHYSTSSHKYVVQSDVYMSETGAYAPCFANFYLQKVDHRFIFGDSNIGRTSFDCLPTYANFNWHFQGLTVPLVAQTLGQRYYGQISASFSYPQNSQQYNLGDNSPVNWLDFNGPSVTMK